MVLVVFLVTVVLLEMELPDMVLDTREELLKVAFKSDYAKMQLVVEILSNLYFQGCWR